MECKGVNGQIEFDGTWVTIRRKGALGRMTVGKGEKKIPLSQIVAVQWKEPGAMVRGYISFTITGAQENKRGFGKQTIDAAKDENAVIVAKGQADEFRALKTAIEAAITNRENVIPGVQVPAPSTADEVAKLVALRDAGALTDDEFQQQKGKLLGQ
jgi:hypothetical protein